MQMNSLSAQHCADEEKESEREHFYGRVSVDEIADEGREDQHNNHCDDNGNDHEQDIGNQTNGGEDGVEGKNDIEKYDLDNGIAKSKPFARGCFCFDMVDFISDFHGCFDQQE